MSRLQTSQTSCLSILCGDKQEDFTRQEISRTSIHLFKVRWNDHLVNSALICRYGINTDILHLTFSRTEF